MKVYLSRSVACLFVLLSFNAKKGFTIMRIFILSAVLFFVAGAAQAATMNVVGGQLIGASGVDVGGSLYDVQFLDGTCIALYNGCDEVSDFTFQTFQDSVFASQALEAQVFQTGIFDTDPYLTNGCSSNSQGDCIVYTPFNLDPDGFFGPEVQMMYFRNVSDTPVGVVQSDFSPTTMAYISYGEPQSDFATFPSETYAVWSTAGSVSAVPIPAAAWLFGSALLALFTISRRRTA